MLGKRKIYENTVLCRDKSLLPESQGKALESLVGGKRARTYVEASKVTGISVNTLYTHLRHVRINHPKLYKAIYRQRRSQPAVSIIARTVRCRLNAVATEARSLILQYLYLLLQLRDPRQEIFVVVRRRAVVGRIGS